jgi:hypothetical protein
MNASRRGASEAADQQPKHRRPRRARYSLPPRAPSSTGFRSRFTHPSLRVLSSGGTASTAIAKGNRRPRRLSTHAGQQRRAREGASEPGLTSAALKGAISSCTSAWPQTYLPPSPTSTTGRTLLEAGTDHHFARPAGHFRNDGAVEPRAMRGPMRDFHFLEGRAHRRGIVQPEAHQAKSALVCHVCRTPFHGNRPAQFHDSAATAPCRVLAQPVLHDRHSCIGQ